jgi:class 3 adenylate cyclase
MDGCFRILMDEIHKYEGTIKRFTGDRVMALFGAPLAHEDHAQRACRPALNIQSALGAYGDSIKQKHGIDFMMRIGLMVKKMEESHWLKRPKLFVKYGHLIGKDLEKRNGLD